MTTTTVKEEVSKRVFDQMGALLDEAAKFGEEGDAEYFKAAAYALGAQMAVTGKPEQMPDFINEVITQIGHGLQVGMQTAHGITGQMNVRVHSVIRS